MRVKKMVTVVLQHLPTVKRRIAVVVALAVICTVTVSAVARLKQAKAGSGANAKPAMAMANPMVTIQTGQVNTTLRADGFTPSEMTHTSGSFTLVVVNESGVQGLNFKMTTESGEVIREMSLPQGQGQWSGIIDLPSGGYYLTEVNHAAWLYHITAQ
jgi:hypothetical protein